jgi:hypothetical protein
VATRQKRGGGEGIRKQAKQNGISKRDPFLLSLPNCLMQKLLDKAYWMPHEVLLRIDCLLILFNNIHIADGAWRVLN